MKKEKPIIFNPEMVRAILNGRKIMTRRIIKPQPFKDSQGWWEYKNSWGNIPPDLDPLFGVDCPYGFQGDILWVRETWSTSAKGWIYKADNPEALKYALSLRWKPSIHMPKKACRLRLMITYVRAERLQDITDEDSLLEGMLPVQDTFKPGELRQAFRKTWEKIHGPGAWKKNPWVWVIQFEQL